MVLPPALSNVTVWVTGAGGSFSCQPAVRVRFPVMGVEKSNGLPSSSHPVKV